MQERLTMLTVKEAAKYAPEHAIRRWVASGELPAVRTGKKWLICESVLRNFLTQGSNHPQMEHEPKQSKIRRIVG